MTIEIQTGAIKTVHPQRGWVLITNPGEPMYILDLRNALHVWANGNWHILNDFSKQVLKRLYG